VELSNEQVQVKAGKVFGSCVTLEQKAVAEKYAELADRYTQTNVRASHCFNAGAHRAFIRRFQS